MNCVSDRGRDRQTKKYRKRQTKRVEGELARYGHSEWKRGGTGHIDPGKDSAALDTGTLSSTDSHDDGMVKVVVVCWLLNVPATGECISGTDLLGQLYVLPH